MPLWLRRRRCAMVPAAPLISSSMGSEAEPVVDQAGTIATTSTSMRASVWRGRSSTGAAAPVGDPAMADRPDDHAPIPALAFDRVQDPIVADPARPQAPEAAPQLLPELPGPKLEQGQGPEDGLMDHSGERCQILLRPVGED